MSLRMSGPFFSDLQSQSLRLRTASPTPSKKTSLHFTHTHTFFFNAMHFPRAAHKASKRGLESEPGPFLLGDRVGYKTSRGSSQLACGVPSSLAGWCQWAPPCGSPELQVSFGKWARSGGGVPGPASCAQSFPQYVPEKAQCFLQRGERRESREGSWRRHQEQAWVSE